MAGSKSGLSNWKPSLNSSRSVRPAASPPGKPSWKTAVGWPLKSLPWVAETSVKPACDAAACTEEVRIRFQFNCHSRGISALGHYDLHILF